MPILSWRWGRMLALLIAALPARPTIAADATASGVRIVDCDAHVQSRKRGICANHLSADDFKAIAPGVSWWYNWDFKPSENPPAGTPIEFYPMVWGDTAARLKGLETYLSAGNKPRCILAINEPNLRGQAFITPEETAGLYVKIKAIADRFGIPVVGPHMALGSAANASISAEDPIQKKKVTYTFMVPFLHAFLSYLDPKEVSATSFHSYGHLGEMKWAVGLMQKEFNRPVWVTEYAQWNAPSASAERTYLIQATDFLERSPGVQGYAWFKERVEKNPKISLLESASGKLTPLGQAYVDLPVHDEDVYYRLPGKLPAANYVALKEMEINPCTDGGGFVQMDSEQPGAALDYNLHIDKPGIYAIHLRASGKPGEIALQIDGRSLGNITSAGGDWQTLDTTAELPAGNEKLQLSFAAKGQIVEWIEFERK